MRKEELVKYANLNIIVNPSGANVYIDGNPVDISKAIRATYGMHQIMAKADGYVTVTQYVRLNENGAKVVISLEEEEIRTVSNNSVITPSTIQPITVSENMVPKTYTDTEGSLSENSVENQIAEDGADSVSSTKNTTDYMIHLQAPVGADLYVNEKYIGVIPVSFEKQPGILEMAIRKPGYVTKIYTVNVDDDKKDSSYSFSNLEPEKYP